MIDLPQGLQYDLTKGYNDIPHFAEKLLGMPLHEGQRTFYKNANQKVNILVPSNRWGKSIAAAIKHIHHCFYKVGIGRGNTEAHQKAHYQTANLAPHSDATKPVFDAIKAIMTSSFAIPQSDGSVENNRCLIDWFIDYDHIRNSTPYYIPFVNNSGILFRSTGEDKGDSIQGKTFGYISYDEGGRSNHLEYELNSNIMPRLADLNGSLDLISTPDMKSSSILYHYELFEKGLHHEPGYYSQEGSIEQNFFLLRNNPTYIRDETERLKGDPILDQVLYGKFVFAGDSLFPADDIAAAVDESLTGGVSKEEGHKYYIGIDTAMGEDEMVYSVLDATNPDEIRLVRQMSAKGNSKSPQIHMDDFLGLLDSYWDKKHNNVRVILETWNGESARFYQDLPTNVQFITKCYGSWQPPGAKVVGKNNRLVKKAEMIIALRKLLANRKLRIPNEPVLKKQLSIYREIDKDLPTDRVISLSLACWYATDGQPKTPKITFISQAW